MPKRNTPLPSWLPQAMYKRQLAQFFNGTYKQPKLSFKKMVPRLHYSYYQNKGLGLPIYSPHPGKPRVIAFEFNNGSVIPVNKLGYMEHILL